MPQNQIANLIASNFIARSDVKAIQFSNGNYAPHLAKQNDPDSERLPWSRTDLIAHLNGERTFGHYLLNHDDKCKIIAFDIDLKPEGFLPTNTNLAESAFEPCLDLRAAWRDRKHPGRKWMKIQFKLIANKLARGLYEELSVPCAVAYSGSKGLHVYGFPGLIFSADAREGARIVLDSISEFQLLRGQNTYEHKDQDPFEGYPNLTIEVYPKQDSLESKDLGNLLRVPLGRNLKNPKDPTFFVDMASPVAELRPADPIWMLTEGKKNPWRLPNE